MQSTLKNRTIFCHDNLDIMRGINSNSIDLIYLDPPFNKNKKFTAPIGSKAEGASFKDIFRKEDVKDEWLGMIAEEKPYLYEYINGISSAGYKYNKYYLIYMAVRLLEMHRILKDTGSIYLHCDPTISHYLKILMDCIFGEENFKNEIVWYYKRWTNAQNNFQKMYDNILFFSKKKDNFFCTLYQPYSEKTIHRKISVDRKTDLSGRDINKGISMNNVWDIPYLHSQSKERIGYPTQKPLELLERIIKASCPLGTDVAEIGIVLDPFCGCATTCVAAERLGAKWIGIDISQKAYEIVKIRLGKEVENGSLFSNKVVYRDDIPKRTDIEKDKRKKTDIKHILYGR